MADGEYVAIGPDFRCFALQARKCPPACLHRLRTLQLALFFFHQVASCDSFPFSTPAFRVPGSLFFLCFFWTTLNPSAVFFLFFVPCLFSRVRAALDVGRVISPALFFVSHLLMNGNTVLSTRLPVDFFDRLQIIASFFPFSPQLVCPFLSSIFLSFFFPFWEYFD